MQNLGDSFPDLFLCVYMSKLKKKKISCLAQLEEHVTFDL